MRHKNIKSNSIAIITNIPAPYRMDIYSHLAKHFGYDHFHVVFCAQKEANRDWVIEHTGFAHTFLKTNYITWKGRYIHYNPDALSVLKQLKPDVIITTGFNPTHLLAFAYAVFTGKVHIPMTDGTYDSELKLSALHRIVRKVVFRFSKTFIGASLGARRLYQSYGINADRFYQSHLCANNAAFTALNTTHKPYELMFSGRFSSEKNPLFALDVAAGVAKNLNRPVSILMLGAGPLLDEAKAYAESLAPQVIVTFPGFLQQAELPALYNSAKVFLFPSSWDPWGVVANEACAAGLAVIVSPHAGVANELVCHDVNGYVLELNLDDWIKHTTELLSNPDLLAQFSKESQIKVQAYSYKAAAQGIIDAVDEALTQ